MTHMIKTLIFWTFASRIFGNYTEFEESNKTADNMGMAGWKLKE